MARFAEVLGVAWSTANTAIIEEGCRMLIDPPDRFDHVTVTGAYLPTDQQADRWERVFSDEEHVEVEAI